jgi:hypothetical protein
MNARLQRVLAIALPAWLVVATCAHGVLLTTETQQRAFATICTAGTCQTITADTVNSTAHANNFAGSLTTPSQARTAGRSGASEIAANATIRHRTGRPFQDLTEVRGTAIYSIVATALTDGDVYLDFHLPPGFIEIESNSEARDFVELTAQVTAELFPEGPRPGLGIDLFEMTSELKGGWETHQLTSTATSVNPNLDLSPLTHQNVSVVESQEIRTKTWEYDAFSGRLLVGFMNAGQELAVVYTMSAKVNSDFPFFQTWAAAAINDPFFLSSDPLPQMQFLQLEQVPEPVGVALALLGVGILALSSRHRCIT